MLLGQVVVTGRDAFSTSGVGVRYRVVHLSVS